MISETLLKLGPWFGPIAILISSIVCVGSYGLVYSGVKSKNSISAAAGLIGFCSLLAFWLAAQ